MFVTSLKTKNAPYNDDAFRVKCVLLLCVADIDFIRAASGLLIPNPHIGDVAVLGISVEIATNIPFGVFAFYTCGDGVIPAIHGSAVKCKSDALSVALGKADPVVNVKDRLSRFFFRRFRWRRFLSCRRCGLFFFSRGSGFRSAFGLVCFLFRFAWLWQHCRAVVSLIGNLCCLGVTFRYACRELCGTAIRLRFCALGTINLRFLFCLSRF